MRLDEVGDWWNPGYDFRGDANYAQYFRDEVERLASLAIERLKAYIGQPKLMAPLRREARRTAEIMFAAEPAGAFLDALYDRVALERTTEPAQLDPDPRRFVSPMHCRLSLTGGMQWSTLTASRHASAA